MTSIMHPGTYARMNAVQARQALTNAATVLRTGTSLEPGKPSIGVPAEQAALLHAERGIDHITTALGVSGQLSAGVVQALTAAKDQASAGVRFLGTGSTKPVDRHQVPGLFDATTMWLGLAVNLIDLDMRGGRPAPTPTVPTPGAPVRPPVTILPVDPPVGIQLPHPDAEIQVEAPEAMAGR